MPQEYKPVPTIQTITPPLALKDSGDRTRFNERAEKNLTDMAKLAEDWNTRVLPPLNIVGEMTNEILPGLPQVINVGRNIASILTVAPHVGNIDTVAADITDVNTVAGGIASVKTTAANIAAVNTAATNIAAVIDAPNQAATATAKAVEAAASALDAASSASDAAQSATDAATSATNAAQSATAAANSADAAAASEASTATMENHVAEMRDALMGGATPEAVPESAMKRDEDGNTKVAMAPTDDAHAASKGYVDASLAAAVAKVDTQGTVSEAIEAAVETDETGISRDRDGRLCLTAAVSGVLAMVDTEGSVTDAIADAVDGARKWAGSAKYVSSAAPAAAIGADGDIYFQLL